MTEKLDADVLVLDSHGQCGLAVVRSLGRRGVRVTAGSDRAQAVGMYSKYATDRYVHPSISADERRFLDHLRAHLAAASYDVVVPVDDGTSTLLSKHKRTLEATGTTVAVEDWPAVDLTVDKARFSTFVADLGLATPATYPIESREALAALPDSLSYPVVLKPRSKSLWDDGRHVELTVSDRNYAASPAELAATYDEVVDAYGQFAADQLVVQEYVPGQTTTTVVLADEGEVRSYFQERRLRTYPASGGNSALLEPVDDDRMLDDAERIVDALGWTGPAMVEFKHTPDDEYVVIEVNGRYWGSLPFAISAGVDFPAQHLRLLFGMDPLADGPPRGEYRTDFRFRRLLYEDVKWLVERLCAGHPQALWPFFTSFATAEHGFVSVDDVRPTLLALSLAPVLGASALTTKLTTGVHDVAHAVTPGLVRRFGP